MVRIAFDQVNLIKGDTLWCFTTPDRNALDLSHIQIAFAGAGAGQPSSAARHRL